VSDSPSWKQSRTSDTRRTSGATEPAAREAIDAELILSASEISSFAFCPEAWHLQRRGVARNRVGVQKLDQGSLTHRELGARVDGVRGTQQMRRVVLLVMVALLAGLLLQLLIMGSLLRP